jgi:hypothetical protein
MKFNVNDNVKVKLTDKGRIALQENHQKFLARMEAHSLKVSNLLKVFTPKKEDANGWSTWQLWHLMEELGPHISIGMDPPFEPNIEICIKGEL